MPRKTNINLSPIAIIRVIVFLLIGFIVFSAYVQLRDYLHRSPIFDIKEVYVDRSIQFIDMRLLKQLKGQNIFEVDINKIHRQIASRYPQIAQLRILRQWPDAIKVLAKKRESLMQLQMRTKLMVVDTEGVTLFYAGQAYPLPIVRGIPWERIKIVWGAPLKGKEFEHAVLIANQFKARPSLAAMNVMHIDVANLSKIILTTSTGVQVVLDQDDIMNKITMLQNLLDQRKVDLAKVKYIDVRFREPIIAENIDEEKGR